MTAVGTRIAIFAMAPVPGSVKTRLIPALGWSLFVGNTLSDIGEPAGLDAERTTQ